MKVSWIAAGVTALLVALFLGLNKSNGERQGPNSLTGDTPHDTDVARWTKVKPGAAVDLLEAPITTSGGHDRQLSQPVTGAKLKREWNEVVSSSDAAREGNQIRARFTVIVPTARPFTGQIVLDRGDGDPPVVTDAPPEGETAVLSAPPGSYTAWAQDANGARGPEQTVSVELGAPPTELVAPFLFDLAVPVIDFHPQVLLPGIDIVLERQEGDRPPGEPSTLRATSDSSGRAVFKDVSEGKWTVTASSRTRWAYPLDLELPGAQIADAVEQARIEVDGLEMFARTEIWFQLDSEDPAIDTTGFHIRYRDEERVPFGADGRAMVSLGDYLIPLDFRLDHPSPLKRSKFFVLEGGLPEDGEDYVIPIDGAQAIEVALEFAPNMLEQLGDGLLSLAVSTPDLQGNTNMIVENVVGPTTRTFASVQGDSVVVELFDGEDVQWAATRVDLKPSGLTTCTIQVEEKPIEILVSDEDGAPVSGFVLRTSIEGDSSRWAGGGTTDARGVTLHARVRSESLRCRGNGMHDGRRFVISDRPFVLDPAAATSSTKDLVPRVEISLTPSTETFIEAAGDAESMRFIEYELWTVTSEKLAWYLRSNAEGMSDTMEWVEGSQAMVHVVSDGGHWTPTPVFELKPGRNEVEVHDSGQLNISSEALLDRVMSVRYGVPVSTWRAQDNLFQLTTKNGVLRYRTPVGDYDVTMPDGSVERITLTKFQEVSAGI
ncbi:hypothetical protein OAV47_00630 [bacterium]|nr:hypothetical protein [bacterium]